MKITSGNSTVNFLGTVGGAANNTGVVIFNITSSSTTPNSGTPDHFDNTPFELSVSVIDELARSTDLGKDKDGFDLPKNEIGTVKFSGKFSADITKGSLTNWGVAWDIDEDSVVLGNSTVGFRKYNVKIDGFLPPSPNSPEINGRGSVHANVIITPVDGSGELPPDDPDPAETPEPSSLLLAGLGLSSLGVAYRRRKQKANS